MTFPPQSKTETYQKNTLQLTNVLHGVDNIGIVTQHTGIRQRAEKEALLSGMNHHRLRSNPVFSLNVDEVRLGCFGKRSNDLVPAIATPYEHWLDALYLKTNSLTRHKTTTVTREKSYDSTGDSQIADPRP